MQKLDNKIIITYFKSGLTQREIGIKLGVSKQRVQQLEKRLSLSRRPQKNRTDYIICSSCGSFVIQGQRQIFCSRACSGLDRKKYHSSKELQEHRRRWAKEYYHKKLKNNLSWVREHRQICRIYIQKRRLRDKITS